MGRNQERVWLEEVVAGGAKEQNGTGTSCAWKRDNMCFRSRNRIKATQGVTSIINAQTFCSGMSFKHQFVLGEIQLSVSVLAAGLFFIFGGKMGTEDTEVSFERRFHPINPKLPYHTYTTYLHAYLAPVAWNMPQLCSQGNI